MSISIRIKELREQKGLSKKDFSSKIGVDNSQYGKFESGKLTPTIPQLLAISSNFDISIDWLLTGEGEMLKSDRDTQIAQTNAISDEQLLQENQKLKDKYIATLEENKKLSSENAQMREEIKNHKKITTKMEQSDGDAKPFVKQDKKMPEPLSELQVHNGMTVEPIV